MTAAFFTPQVLHHRDERNQWTRMFGYGLEFALDDAGAVIFAEKEGINTGVSAIIRHYPAKDLNVVLLSNMQMGVWEPLKTIHRLLGHGAGG